MAVERQLGLGEVIEFAKNGYITKVINEPDDQFLWKGDGTKYGMGDEWFDHTKARKGSIFYDGNNGDRHKIHYIDVENRRMVVENQGQHEGMYEMWYW